MAFHIAVITATRAEYGLLKPLILALQKDDYFQCDVIATGTHLLEKYGHTIDYIREDGIPIAHEVAILHDGESQEQVIANALIEFSKVYQKENYDAVVVLGDRYELYGICIPAMFRRIPIIHLHGGEKTEGAMDEKIRHSITKMSSIHFPSIEEYAKRIIQMGENPKYVHAVGALGIDNIVHLPLLSKDELSESLGVVLEDKYALVTFHPVTMESVEDMKRQVCDVFEVLVESGIQSIVTMPNSDVGGDDILEIIKKYADSYSDKIKLFSSLGQVRYLSCMKYAEIVYGNSSSGILEAASFRVPTIDIGDRQKGRVAADSVIHCKCDKESIKKALELAQSRDFRNKLANVINPYGDGNTATRIVDILKNTDWTDETIVKKEFYDL